MNVLARGQSRQVEDWIVCVKTEKYTVSALTYMANEHGAVVGWTWDVTSPNITAALKVMGKYSKQGRGNPAKKNTSTAKRLNDLENQFNDLYLDVQWLLKRNKSDKAGEIL